MAARDEKITELEAGIENDRVESRQSTALFATIASVAYDSVFVLDQDMNVIAMNRSAETLFGDKNPIGDRLSDVLDAPDLDNLVQRAPEETEGLEEQFIINRTHYRVRTQVMEYEGGDTFIGVALQDISRLVRLNRARRDMVANISHELGGPIANIRLIIDSLFYDEDKPKRKDSISSLKAIGKEVDSLQNLAREMLDLSMIESGQALMKLQEESLRDIVEESIERLEDQIEDKKVSMALHIPETIAVLVDREHIRRVIMNLVSNAIKYSPENDVISINARSDGDEATISVLDNGPGVPGKRARAHF